MHYRIRIKPLKEQVATIEANSYEDALNKLFQALKSKIEMIDETEYNENKFHGGKDIYNQLKNIMGI